MIAALLAVDEAAIQRRITVVVSGRRKSLRANALFCFVLFLLCFALLCFAAALGTRSLAFLLHSTLRPQGFPSSCQDFHCPSPLRNEGASVLIDTGSSMDANS